jgi:hypothetical protein
MALIRPVICSKCPNSSSRNAASLPGNGHKRICAPPPTFPSTQ